MILKVCTVCYGEGRGKDDNKTCFSSCMDGKIWEFYKECPCKCVSSKVKVYSAKSCKSGGNNHAWEYYKDRSNGQKRRCSDCGKIDYNYYTPNYYK